MNKKVMILALISVLELSSCSMIDNLKSDKTTTTTTEATLAGYDYSGTQSRLSAKEEPYENVTITLPALMVGDAEEYAEGLRSKPDKVVSAEANADGSVTATFTPEGYTAICEAAAQAAAKTLGDILNSGDYSTLKAIDYNSDFTEYDVYVSDANKYTTDPSERLYLVKLKLSTKIYHVLTQSEDVDPIVNIYDENEILIDTIHLNDIAE